MYLEQSLIVCFVPLSCMSTNPWATSRVPDRITWCFSLRCLIEFAFQLAQIPDITIGKAPPRDFCMLYGWCDTGCWSSFNNSSPKIDPLIWDKDFNILFAVQRILFYSSIVLCLGALVHWKFVTLFCFLNNGFLTAILPYRQTSQSLLLRVDIDTFFHDIGSVVQWCFEQPAFCHVSWWLRWNCPLVFLLS